MLCGPSLARAATRYVAPSGSGSAPCTNINDPCSLSTGLSQTVAGETLYLRGGTYNQSIQDMNAGTSFSNAVTIASYPGETATLRPSGTTEVINLHGTQYHHIIFDRLRLDIANLGNVCPTTQGNPDQYGLVVTGGAHHVRFQDGEIFSSSTSNGCGPLVFWGVNDDESNYQAGNEVLRTKLHGAIQSYAFYIQTGGNLIDGCEMYDNGGYGFQIYNSYNTESHNNVIRNNKIYRNGFYRNLGGVGIFRGNNTEFYNNILYENAGTIALGGSSGTPGNVFVANNTIHGNGNVDGAGIAFWTGTGQVTNNIVSHSGTPFINDAGGTLTANLCSGSGTGCAATGTAQFLNAAGGDFHLTSGSAAIGMGTNLSSRLTTDAEGLGRPSSGAWDVGAYVFQGAPAPSPVGILARLLFEEGTGTTAADSSGQGRTCTLNSAGWVTGSSAIIGTASFSLNGSRWCTIPGSAAVKPTTQAGLAGWMRRTTVGPNGEVLQALPNDALISYLTPTGQLSCQAYDGTTFFAATGGNGLTGTNRHVSCSFEQGVGLRLRVDNAQIAFTPMSTALSYSLAGDGNVQVGRSDTSTTLYNYGGVLDNVYVFDQAITDEGNTNLFNEQVPSTGLDLVHMGWYQANAAQGAQIGAIDSDLSHLLTSPLGVRHALRKNDPGSLTEYFKVQCRTNTGAGYGAWTDVANSFGGLGVRFYADSVVTTGTPTSTILPLGTYTGVASVFLRNPVDTTAPYDAAQRTTMAQNQQAEQEARMEFGSPLTAGHAVQCRPVRENGAVLDSYGIGDVNIKTITLLPAVAPSLTLTGGTTTGGTQR